MSHKNTGAIYKPHPCLAGWACKGAQLNRGKPRSREP